MKSKRTRFKRAAICSSFDYKASRKIHEVYIREVHEFFECSELKVKLSSEHIEVYYARCCGSLVKIPKEIYDLNPDDCIKKIL